MARQRPTDIVVELVELAHDLMQDMRQQLSYYRASVYKGETAAVIAAKVEKLRVITLVVGDDALQEALRDYDAMTANGAMHCAPGECSLSHRLTTLLNTLEDQLSEVMARAQSRMYENESAQGLAQMVSSYRQEIISACRQGSRQWAFFQNL